MFNKILPAIIITVLCCVFLLSSLILYRRDIYLHDKEMIRVASEIEKKLNHFNKHIIVKDNESIKDEQIVSSDKSDEILKILRRIEDKLDGQAGVPK